MEFRKNRNFQKALAFFKKMQKEGLLRPPRYDVPPLDTIGRRLVRRGAAQRPKG